MKDLMPRPREHTQIYRARNILQCDVWCRADLLTHDIATTAEAQTKVEYRWPTVEMTWLLQILRVSLYALGEVELVARQKPLVQGFLQKVECILQTLSLVRQPSHWLCGRSLDDKESWPIGVLERLDIGRAFPDWVGRMKVLRMHGVADVRPKPGCNAELHLLAILVFVDLGNILAVFF